MIDPRLCLYKAADVRELDRRAIEERGIEGFDLMGRAASAAFNVLREQWPETERLHIFCGPGNNGGDGYLLAVKAIQAGYELVLEALAPPGQLQGDAARAHAAFVEAGGQVQTAPAGEIVADVVVDALLGTGSSRPLEGKYLEAVNRINAAGVPVLSIDVPTGLDADTGIVLGAAVKADVTVSFIGQKLGCFTARGPEYCRRRVFDALQVPEAVYRDLPVTARIVDDAYLGQCLPPRARDSHKNQHGHVLCIGGDFGTAGAIRLAAEAALRSGAGLVSVATRPEIAVAMAQARPELMCKGVESAEALSPLLDLADAVLVGPGLGQDAWGQDLFSRVLQSGLPIVVDADALNLLAAEPVRRDNWVLTPHPGEATRLLGMDKTAIQADRLAAVQALAGQYGAISLLKGAGTLVADPNEEVWLCDRGNPGMAVGGMGDLLGGVVVALIAQGLSPAQATPLAAYIHAQAGDMAAQDGERGLIPTDLLPFIRRLVNP